MITIVARKVIRFDRAFARFTGIETLEMRLKCYGAMVFAGLVPMIIVNPKTWEIVSNIIQWMVSK